MQDIWLIRPDGRIVSLTLGSLNMKICEWNSQGVWPVDWLITTKDPYPKCS